MRHFEVQLHRRARTENAQNERRHEFLGGNSRGMGRKFIRVPIH
jgi:hypothetical protein